MRLLKTLGVAVGATLLMALPVLAQQGAAKGGKTPHGGVGSLPSSSAVAPPPASGAVAGKPAPPLLRARTPVAGTAPLLRSPGLRLRRPGPRRRPPRRRWTGPTYAVRLRDLEQKIDELKEQIRRSHTRHLLLSDTILSGGGAGSRAGIKFNNELSSAFRVTRALFVLDGAVQYNKTDQSGALADQAEIPIFSGSIPPGDHTVQVLLNLQGNGYGVFSYLRGYRFEVRSSHSFTAVEGKTFEPPGRGLREGRRHHAASEERPAIRYVEEGRDRARGSERSRRSVVTPAGAPAGAKAITPKRAPSQHGMLSFA